MRINLSIFLCALLSTTASWAQLAQNSADAATINNSTSVKGGSTGSISSPIEELHLKPSKWSTSAFIGNWGDLAALDGGPKNQSFTDIYIEPKKDIGNGQSLALRINAMRYQRADENSDELVAADPQIIYRNKAFASALRLSFPVLEFSREVGRHELRYNGGMDLYTNGRFTTSLLIEARAYGYTKDDDGQLRARGLNGLGFGYKINDRISPYFNAMYDTRWSNSGEGIKFLDVNTKADPKNLVRNGWFDLGSSFVIIPKHLNFDAYLTQIRAVDANTELFAKEDTSYNFELSATF